MSEVRVQLDCLHKLSRKCLDYAYHTATITFKAFELFYLANELRRSAKERVMRVTHASSYARSRR